MRTRGRHSADWTEDTSGLLVSKPAEHIREIVCTAEEFLRQTFPEKHRILDFLNEREIALMSGWRGAGKTFFILSMLESITCRVPFGPWQAHQAVPALYLDGELAEVDLQSRIRALHCHERLAPLYLYSDNMSTSRGLGKANLSSKKWRDNLGQLLIDKGIKVWCLDNISSISGGIQENVAEEWVPVNDWLMDLRFKGITSILIHHVGLSGKQRGTTKREDNVDLSIRLVQPPNHKVDDGASFILKWEKTRLPESVTKLLREYRFHLQTYPNGALGWTWEDNERGVKKDIYKLLDEGKTPKEIADELEVSSSFVYRVKRGREKDHSGGNTKPQNRV